MAWAGLGQETPKCPLHHPLTCGPGHSTELSCPTLLQRCLHFSSGWKNLPQGQVSNHQHWKPSRVAGSPGTVEPWAQLPAEHRLQACVCPAPVFSPVVLLALPQAGAAPWHSDIPVRCGMLCPGNKRAWQHPILVTVPWRNEAGPGDQLA